MRSPRVRILVVLILAAGISAAVQKDTPVVHQRPPDTPVRDVKETFFGTEVTDPYRWLEDLKSPEVTSWMRALAKAGARRSTHLALPEEQRLSPSHRRRSGKDIVVFGNGLSPSVTMTETDFPFVSVPSGSKYAFGVVAHGVQNEATIYVTSLDSLHDASALSIFRDQSTWFM